MFVEGARCDEEHVVRADGAVLAHVYGRACSGVRGGVRVAWGADGGEEGRGGDGTPSMSGRRSRWTPSADASPLCLLLFEMTLSISSAGSRGRRGDGVAIPGRRPRMPCYAPMNTMPFCSARLQER